MTDPATVPDQPVGGGGPVTPRQERADVVLDLVRVGLRRPAEPPRQPGEMGVYREAWLAEGIAEHHIGGLSANTRQGDEFVQRVWDLPAEAVAQLLAKGDEALRLGAEEPVGWIRFSSSARSAAA